MVMAGESATNDVDEEVYDNVGDERNEAPEASDVDRRAIADAVKLDSLIFLVKRKLQEYCVLLNRPQTIQRLVPDLCCEARTTFSAQTSCGEQDGRYSAEIPDRLHVHSNSGREQNSAMYHIRGKAQWSGDQLHVRLERWL